jgi:hypothetical protein
MGMFKSRFEMGEERFRNIAHTVRICKPKIEIFWLFFCLGSYIFFVNSVDYNEYYFDWREVESPYAHSGQIEQEKMKKQLKQAIQTHLLPVGRGRNSCSSH